MSRDDFIAGEAKLMLKKFPEVLISAHELRSDITEWWCAKHGFRYIDFVPAKGSNPPKHKITMLSEDAPAKVLMFESENPELIGGGR